MIAPLRRASRCIRSVALLGLLAVMVGACAPASAPSSAEVDLAAEEAAIHAALDRWHAAAAASDVATYAGLLAEDAIFLGTDASERWTKEELLAYARPRFEAGRGWVMRSIRRDLRVDPSGTIAHFDEELEARSLGPSRGSGVLVRRAGVWLILHYNLAVTVPNERFAALRSLLRSEALLGPEEASAAGWLAGSWVGRGAAGERVEEHWTHPAAG